MKYEVKNFNDGQVAAKIVESGDLHIKIRGNSYKDLFKVASIKEAWDAENATNKLGVAQLTIFCLIGQRSDRRFNKGESFDLKVICNFINSMNFDKVSILHPHSPISLALIHNSEKLSHFSYVEKTFHNIGNPVLVSPDAGAYKTTHEIAEKLNDPEILSILGYAIPGASEPALPTSLRASFDTAVDVIERVYKARGITDLSSPEALEIAKTILADHGWTVTT